MPYEPLTFKLSKLENFFMKASSDNRHPKDTEGKNPHLRSG